MPTVAAAPRPVPLVTAIGFSELPGWRADHLAQALPPFLASCAAWGATPPPGWAEPCAAARTVPPGDDAARAFFEASFTPYALRDPASGSATGLFTGYYEPEVAGSRVRSRIYATPLLRRPADLVQVDLGAFAPDLAGRRITGRVERGRLRPYPDRGAIVAGGARRQRVLVWLKSPVDAFFLQIQGSGRVRLPGGPVMRVNYDAGNGRAYVPIGRVLIERGALERGHVSMQSIRTWLEAHPEQAAAVMDANPSYVFFRALPGVSAEQGPPGTMGAPLTPGRSLAVDPKIVPLGAPVFVATTDPLDGHAFARLMLAQDTGGAIRGAVRGDVFWGWGDDAATRAGLMQAPGTAAVLLPRGAPPPAP